MTIDEIRDNFFARGRFGIRPGLESTRHMLHSLGHPERNFPVIHIAGTNGKGSTAAFLSSLLYEGGYRVGLFTSPHLITFTERFRIDGHQISEEKLVSLAVEVLAVAPAEATFFELVTVLALLYFSREKVDMAILEVGMGGRLDATNAVSGILSIITPVSLDHCRYLGRTVKEIAGEKAGIINGAAPVVTSSQDCEALAVIAARATECGAPLYRCGIDFRAEWREELLDYHGLKEYLSGLILGIPGLYQADNAACALAAAELLAETGFPEVSSSLSRGIQTAFWPGRMELFPGPPRILLDGAHNPAGVGALLTSLERIPRARLIMVAGIMEDKDREGILTPLLVCADEVITVNVNLPLATSAVVLADCCTAHGKKAAAAGDVAQGMAMALEHAGSHDLILVTGSLYLVGAVRSILLNQPGRLIQG